MNQKSIQDIVDAVKASNCLGKSKRQYGLLRYLLSEKQSGRLENITQYSIAKDVLGRGEDFDPTSDSIVRVEMHRLRKNLEEFNESSKELQIAIPPASFEIVVTHEEEIDEIPYLSKYRKPLTYSAIAMAVAVFSLFSISAHKKFTTPAPACSTILPNISVANSGQESDLQLYVNKLIRSTLTQYSNIQLVDNSDDCAHSGAPYYTVDNMVLEEDENYRIALTTYNEQATNIVDFKNISGVTTIPNDEDNLYFAIVRTVGDLAKPYGAVPRHAMTLPWASELARKNYGCLILKYDSYTTDSVDDHNRSAKCLSVAAKTDIASLDIKAGAAETYLSQARGYLPKTVQNPMTVVEQTLASAGENWINSVEMTTIKLAYEVERPDFNADRLKEHLNVAEARYSENPLILIYVSGYYGIRLGDWDRAKNLSNKIKRMHFDRFDSLYTVDAMYSLLHTPPEKIMDTCVLTYSEHSLLSNLIINACARRAKDSRWVKKTDNNLTILGYPDKAQRVRFIQNKKLDEEFATEFIKALNLPPD